MAASKGTPSVKAERNPLRMVLFILSMGLCLLCCYLILDFQSSASAKLSGELILGQVDSTSYNHQDSPILSFLFEYFGILIYFFALMIVYLGYFLVLKPVDIWHADFYKGSLRILGFNCTLLGLAGILSRYSDLGATGAGGLLGDMLNMFCDLVMPSLLSIFIFALVALCGISMLMGNGPFYFFDNIGELFFKVLPAKTQTKKHHSLDNDDMESLAATGAATAALSVSDEVQGSLLNDIEIPNNIEQGPSAELQEHAQQTSLLDEVKSLELPQEQALGITDNEPQLNLNAAMRVAESDDTMQDLFDQVARSEQGSMEPQDQEAALPGLSRDSLTAEQQLFAHDLPAEEDNTFTNALAGLEEHESLAQVPPMPDLNSQESVPDFFAQAMQSTKQPSATYNQEYFEQSSLKNKEPYATTSIESPDNIVSSKETIDNQGDRPSPYYGTYAYKLDAQSQQTQGEAVTDSTAEPMVNEVAAQEEPSPYYGTYASKLDAQSQQTQGEAVTDSTAEPMVNEVAAQEDPSPYYDTDASKLDAQSKQAQEESVPEIPVDSMINEVATQKEDQSPYYNTDASKLDAQSKQAQEESVPETPVDPMVNEVASQEEPSPYYGTYASKLDAQAEIESKVTPDKQEVGDIVLSEGSGALVGSNVASSQVSSEASAIDSTEAVAKEVNDAVHTIVQRTDPKVIAAQLAAKKKEKEERERKEREERERKAREQRERNERERAERERKAQEERERKERERQEQERLEQERLEDERLEQERLANEKAQAQEYLCEEEEEEAPLYLGTYASQLEREKAAQNGGMTRKVKVAEEDNSNDRPSTIIRDSRKENDIAVEDNSSKSEILEELSSLASEMNDANLTTPNSTNIQIGSGAPALANNRQRFVQGNDNVTTTIKRNDEVEDNDFYRFATTRDNEMQGQERSLIKSVEVNLFDDDDTFEPKHAYNFGGNQVGKLDESLSGTASDDDSDDFVTGATVPAKGVPGAGGFDFARFVHEDKDEEEEIPDSPSDDNIIAFSKFDKKPKSYEVDSLTSAFIPTDDDLNSIRPKSNSSVFDNSISEREAVTKVQAKAQEATERLASEQAAASASLDSEDEQESEEENYPQADAFTANPMMANPAMYTQMANNQQMQYMQLPNGQYVPVVNNGMMYPGMAMGQMMPNMGQFMQLPNGQYVPVMNPNMMYPNGQMPMGMMPMANNPAMVNMMPNAALATDPSQLDPSMFEQPVSQEEVLVSEAPVAVASAPAVAPIPSVNNSDSEIDAHSMGEHGPSAVGLPTAGNAFMGAHNSSSSNFPSYMAGVSQKSEERSSLALCSVPRRHYDSWRPSLDLLARSKSKVDVSLDELAKTAERIDNVLHSFGVKASVADYLTGPVITRFDLELAPGVKSSAISSIDTELCRNLMVPNVRVVPIIEGSSYVGLEVPNPERQFITLADMASSREFQESDASLPMCLGASVVGAPVVKDLADSPHLLVAGTTGSGKSAGLNTMLISLLLKRSPSELRLILVDPKQLEFSIYKDLPHLITPVITDVAEKTPIALRWCVDEMERRFKLMSLLGVRKLSEYNELIRDKAAHGQSVPDPLWNKELSSHPQALEPLPWIVVVVEEFADLMAQSGRKKDKDGTPESLIARLSAKSRAAGIHLVLVTQTPRSEVVTGMIKANFPSRVAFTVQNRIDSTIVLDEKGAECLLGNGDMLYKFTGEGTSTRAHGAFTSNADVMAVVNAWKQYAGAPEYLEDVVAVPEEEVEESEEGKAKELDVKFDQAVSVVRDYMERRNKPPTVTDLQTELGVGYPRAKKIFMQLSREGIID